MHGCSLVRPYLTASGLDLCLVASVFGPYLAPSRLVVVEPDLPSPQPPSSLMYKRAVGAGRGCPLARRDVPPSGPGAASAGPQDSGCEGLDLPYFPRLDNSAPGAIAAVHLGAAYVLEAETRARSMPGTANSAPVGKVPDSWWAALTPCRNCS